MTLSTEAEMEYNMKKLLIVPAYGWRTAAACENADPKFYHRRCRWCCTGCFRFRREMTKPKRHYRVAPAGALQVHTLVAAKTASVVVSELCGQRFYTAACHKPFLLPEGRYSN